MDAEKNINDSYHRFITSTLLEYGVTLFGVADLSGIPTLRDTSGDWFASAISFAVRMNPEIMVGIRSGPNQAYADEYARVNIKIDSIAASLVTEIQATGFEARTLSASKRTDPINIKGDFPHKTAATRAGLGWVGRNCLLITRKHGPWIRLGTVFINLPLDCETPLKKIYCGTCKLCVEACPAGAIVGNHWTPDTPREKLLDVFCCDKWKMENYFRFHNGHNCGICAAVCPFGK